MSSPTSFEHIEHLIHVYFDVNPGDADLYTAEQIQAKLLEHFPPRNAGISEVQRWILLWLGVRLCLQIPHYFRCLHRIYWSGKELYELPKKELYKNLSLWGMGAAYSYGIMTDIVRARDRVIAVEKEAAELTRQREHISMVTITPADRLEVKLAITEDIQKRNFTWELPNIVIRGPLSGAEGWKVSIEFDKLKWKGLARALKRFWSGISWIHIGVILTLASFTASALWIVI